MSNNEVEVVFPNGSKKMVVAGTTLHEVAKEMNAEAVIGSIDGTLLDLFSPIDHPSHVSFYGKDSQEGLAAMRRSIGLVFSGAIKKRYKKAVISEIKLDEHGFFVDMRLDQSLSILTFKEIEQDMKALQKNNNQISKEIVSVKEAKAIFKDNDLQLELLEALPEEDRGCIYQFGEGITFSKEPFALDVKPIKNFKLLKVSGAYWQGNSDNEMLQRVNGVVFSSKDDLAAYLAFLEESEKRSHQKLGKELKLFMFSEEAPGMPFYLSNGQTVRNELEKFLRELQTRYDYDEVKTPLIMNERLWRRSGHWDHYKDNMYFTKVDDQDYALKPMNCPGHCMIYKDDVRSYRDLPIRMAEFGQVHRHEFSGALNGLLRVRTFCQDDAHIFVSPDQIEAEITLALKIIDEVYKVFGFEYSVELSTRPDDFMGEIAMWDKAENSLKEVLDSLGYNYAINEGDGAFYGPKIDIHIKDALNRSHQCATVQLDFQMPEKFDLSFIDQNNEKQRPVMIHRAVFGSLDRFFGILIEHYAGAFPVWLAPKQVELLSVAEKHNDYVDVLYQEFQENGIRVSKDVRNEKLGKKIREAELRKAPYSLVIGDHEMNGAEFAVRKRGSQEIQKMDKQAFVEMVKKQIAEKNHSF
ncbi:MULTISPECIES: threonine--tRNA ligase [unclassified Enterococcus]|uniref:threonine--tRNA ligase n=1 Tax=unclassified Enterococcus TaxID=2608891 RepID=UPI000A348268|nr:MULTISPECIES: threonine--tRNA ligase [unclassified Enterococcus]OTO72494.1 threonine-tRNA ligase [Enterococcus sp. 12E11_DIV0728]OUZ13950.1 threonine-tRNA ligase [Enterococcus sp. 12F9_DIV0723]